MSENLFQKQIETFGVDSQWRQLQEECGELIAAVNQVVFRGRDPVEKVLEELCSVELMIQQIKFLLKCPNAYNQAYEKEKEKSWDAIKEHQKKIKLFLEDQKANCSSIEDGEGSEEGSFQE